MLESAIALYPCHNQEQKCGHKATSEDWHCAGCLRRGHEVRLSLKAKAIFYKSDRLDIFIEMMQDTRREISILRPDLNF